MKTKPKDKDLSERGIEVILRNVKENPSCPHGPTLLFSKLYGETRRNFFACSACRDRKLCNFFLWQDELDKISEQKKKLWENQRVTFLKNIKHRKLFWTLNKVKSMSCDKRIYCQTCSKFVIKDVPEQHENHSLLTNITDYQLSNPSQILIPLSNSKQEAQYLFSKNSVTTLTHILNDLKIKNVVCIGTPRIHEHIRSEYEDINSLLLDFDARFHNFFGPLEFCWYNFFNHHFFFEEGRSVFREFLKSTKGNNTILITDPPFGGRIEPLAFTINKINAQYKKLSGAINDLPVFWIFPYFMEPQIVNFLPNFVMLDYKVEYDNHPLFQNGPKGRKQGSPVRIFTNLDPSLITLPKDYYKYCNFCKKWVAKENRHCKQCDACTSKNGETYIHCDICEKCVKPRWQHCNKCNKCTQVDHKCQQIAFTKACFNCKELGHKKNECRRKSGVTKKKKKIKIS